MASHNRVILLGNLTRDIELRHTPGGTPVTEIGMAINDRRKNANGDWVDDVVYVDVTLWGRTAEVASEYLHKGSQIFVEGRLKLDTWETEGQKRSKLRVVGERMQMLGGRGDDSGGRSSGYSGNRRNSSGGDYYEADDAAHESDHAPAGRRDAQPTGEGPGYHEEDIPF